MKAPFPLLLPCSPSPSEEDMPHTTCTSGLRRTSTSYNDLRSIAQRHAATPVTPLLPSPITIGVQEEGQCYFQFHNPRAQRPTSKDESLDKLQILSYYLGDEEEHVVSGEDSSAGSTNDGCDDDDDDDAHSQSDYSPVTPIDQTCHDVFRSDESGWLANTTSHEERRRRFKARFYQVVQHPYSNHQGAQGDDHVVSRSRTSERPETDMSR